MSAIKISSLHKTFNNSKRALRDINLEIDQGEMVALIGASGPGKSTLLRHIGGLIPGDRGIAGGEVRVLGDIMQSSLLDLINIDRSVNCAFKQYDFLSRDTQSTTGLTHLKIIPTAAYLFAPARIRG